MGIKIFKKEKVFYYFASFILVSIFLGQSFLSFGKFLEMNTGYHQSQKVSWKILLEIRYCTFIFICSYEGWSFDFVPLNYNLQKIFNWGCRHIFKFKQQEQWWGYIWTCDISNEKSSSYTWWTLVFLHPARCNESDFSLHNHTGRLYSRKTMCFSCYLLSGLLFLPANIKEAGLVV